ncbi:hypothetical protein SAMN05660642_03450 [Geodermatophilus siccatus]|uniref:Uncharacterized protein n=1 Tax=Geodermatophilus siccatus TaxID=1137991 RepID=A0A1G9WN02_9ACTN|nr:hypothetical protein [Geodermatophilus siccatus]SDM85556.1 hypothetical protein SAMN05660642_03450 [Geodermatophilus siccatus]
MTHSSPTPEPPAPRHPTEAGTQGIAFTAAGATAAGTHHLPRVDADPLPGGVQPTGPVGAMPGPPGTAAADPAFGLPLTAGEGIRRARARTSRPPRTPRPARTPRTARPPQERAARIGTGLTALSLLLLQLGLGLGFGETPLWSAVTLWSVFATLATLVGALPFAGRVVPAARQHPDAAWKAAAAGLTGVAVFWVLVVLPQVGSDRGFVLTAALAALGAALWIAPSRSRG